MSENTTQPTPDPNEPNFLTAEAILASDDIDYVDVEVPEWKINGKPGVIRLRAMTAEESQAYNKANETSKGDGYGYVRIVAMTAINHKTGDRLFTEFQAALLKKKKSGIFIRLQDAALELNGLKDAAAAVLRAKNV